MQVALLVIKMDSFLRTFPVFPVAHKQRNLEELLHKKKKWRCNEGKIKMRQSL